VKCTRFLCSMARASAILVATVVSCVSIVDALNALRHRYTYVFTTGGIGPTHGDITAGCVAKAFGVPIDRDPRALAIFHEWVKTTGAEMNEARRRLTRIPKGADLILNKVSGGTWFLDRQCNRDGGRTHAHRPRRIGLRYRDARHGRQRSSARCQMQERTAGKFHFEPPFTSFDHL